MARRSNPDSEAHIKRIDSKKKSSKSTHGFQVHFDRDGRTWTKFFSDAIHGGKEKARTVARKYRDSLEKKVPASKFPSPLRENATGYSLRTHKKRNGQLTRYISASASTELGITVRKAFRIENDDMAKAVKAALDWRLTIATQRLKKESGLRR
jgi:hypothetical protein